MGYALYKLSKEDATIFVKLTEKCWNGKERDLSKLNKYERAVLLKLMDEAGEYNPGERPVKKEPAAKSFSESIHKYNKWHDPKTGRFTSAPDKGFANGGAPAKKPKANVKIKHEVTDYYEGESYCQYTAYDGDKVAGYIKYSQVDDGSPYVHYIETAEEYRGQGVATKLLQQMQHDIGDNEINFGYTTDDGTKLLENVLYTVTDKSIQAKFDKLENIKAKLDKEQRILDELWEKFDAEDTPELREQLALHGDKWQQLYDAIPGIERSLDGLKPTKRYVKMDGFEPVEKGKSKSFLDAIQKFNPYHDPKTGRFTTASGGYSGGVDRSKVIDGITIPDKILERTDGEIQEYVHRVKMSQRFADEWEPKLKEALPNSSISLNFTEMDADVAQSTVETIQKMTERYPLLKNAVKGVDVEILDYKCPDGVMAAYDRNDKTITLYNSYYGDKTKFESAMKETIEKKFHPAGTDYNAIVAHELGHAIDHYLSEKKGHAVSSDLLKTVSMQYQRAGKRLDGETMTNELSGYATSNAREFFAEAMAEYVACG